MDQPFGRERSELWLARDDQVLWHPFTQHQNWREDEPLVIDSAEGMWITDVDGNRYLDGVSSLWVTVHGHRVPEIDAAIAAQLSRLDHVTFLGQTHTPGIELAERLIATVPDGDRALTRVFYAGDGSSAVEAAIKMAYQAQVQRGHDRPLYVHVAEGYHGDTLGAVSVGGIDLFHQTYRPLMLGTLMVSSPGVRAERQSSAERSGEVLDELRTLLAERGDEVCALIVEPMVQAAGGMLTHDAEFLRGARALCDEFGVLLIADEVATGVGRTGRMWACEHAGIVPDLLTCGKGVTGGYLPLSAVLTTEEVFEAFLGAPAEARTFFHGHSYTANPLACAAAIASLDLMAERGTVARAEAVGNRMGERLEKVAGHTGVREIRRIGTMTGIELHPRGDRTGFAVCQAAKRKGVWIRPLGDVVVLMPPLAIGDDDLDLLLDVTTEAIDEVVG